MLVSGVRSSCEASATNSRWRAGRPRSPTRAAPSSPSMSSSVWARSATSSLAEGLGRVVAGSRVRATSRAARGEAGDGPHRAARHGQPGQEGQRRAAEHAEAEEGLDAARWWRSGRRAGARTARSPPARRSGGRAWATGSCRRRRCPPAAAARRRGSAPTSRRSSLGGPRFAPFSGAEPITRPERSSTRISAPPADGGAEQVLGHGGLGPQADAVGQAGGGRAQLGVEARVQPPHGERADHHGEQQEDHEGQPGRDHGELEPDRKPQPRLGEEVH